MSDSFKTRILQRSSLLLRAGGVMVQRPDILKAEDFILRTARLVDRHRYAYLFKGASAEPVVAALAPYQNADGGFGNALEPDLRGSASQPVTVYSAFAALDDIGRLRGEMVTRAVDYLSSVTTPAGGVPVALANVREAPRAPFVNVRDKPAPGLLPTASLAGLLLKHHVEHPWHSTAMSFCWSTLEALKETHPYEVEHSLIFLEYAPDRTRAAKQAERLRRVVRDGRLVLLDPSDPTSARVAKGYAPGELHTPLSYAPWPDSLARQWFSDQEIERALDALAGGQREDGGWMFNWRVWNEATTLESRGLVTIDALKTLRAYGRLPDQA